MANLNDFRFTVGIDIAKSVFQVYTLDHTSGAITNEKVKR